MKTDELIVELARDLKPVLPLRPPSIRVWRWLAAVAAVSVLGVLLLGTRPDLASAFGNAAYDGRFLLTLAAGVLAGVAAFDLSVPGVERSRVERIVPVACAVAWALLLGVLLVSGGGAVDRLIAFPVNWPCGYKISAFSVIVGGMLLVAVRRAAPLELTWTGALVSLCSTALAAAGTQLICPVDDAAHQLVGHVLPVATLALIGTLIARRALDWHESVAGNV